MVYLHENFMHLCVTLYIPIQQSTDVRRTIYPQLMNVNQQRHDTILTRDSYHRESHKKRKAV